MATIRQLYEETAMLCNIDLAVDGEGLFVGTDSIKDSKIFASGFNEAIYKIAKERYSAKFQTRLVFETEPNESYYVGSLQTTEPGNNYTETNSIKSIFKINKISEINNGVVKNSNVNWYHKIDTGTHTHEDGVHKSLDIATKIFLPDYTNAQIEVFIASQAGTWTKYFLVDGEGIIKNINQADGINGYKYVSGYQMFPFPDEIVDWNIVAYYAAHKWLTIQNGDIDQRQLERYYNNWLKGFNSIHNTIDDTGIVMDVYGGCSF